MSYQYYHNTTGSNDYYTSSYLNTAPGYSVPTPSAPPPFTASNVPSTTPPSYAEHNARYPNPRPLLLNSQPSNPPPLSQRKVAKTLPEKCTLIASTVLLLFFIVLCIGGSIVIHPLIPLFAIGGVLAGLQVKKNIKELLKEEKEEVAPFIPPSRFKYHHANSNPQAPIASHLPSAPSKPASSDVIGTTSISSSAPSFSLNQAYEQWKSKYLKIWSENGVDYARVIQMHTEYGARTVSEGMGYGMLLAVESEDRSTFDGLMHCVQKYCDPKNGGNGLMPWAINDWGVEDPGSATDGDLDITLALLNAYFIWGDQSYYTCAKAMADKIMELDTYIGSGGIGTRYPWQGRMINPGNGWGTNGQYNFASSYFCPNHFRLFAIFMQDPRWNELTQNGWIALQGAADVNTGLVPDWFNQVTYGPAQNMPNDRNYGYDACRVPFRLIEWQPFTIRRNEVTAFLLKMNATFQNSLCPSTGGLAGGYNIFNGQRLNDWDGQPQFNAPVAASLARLDPNSGWLNKTLQPLNYSYLTNMPGPGWWDSAPYYNSTLGLLCEMSIAKMQRPQLDYWR